MKQLALIFVLSNCIPVYGNLSPNHELLYTSSMDNNAEWHIINDKMNYSFSSGILSSYGSSTSAGSVQFLHLIDTSGYMNIYVEFDYRKAGSIIEWEYSDWIRFIAYSQQNPPVAGDPAITGAIWRYKPPSSWTTRGYTFSDDVAKDNEHFWVGIQTRTTQTGEIIQVDNFRVYGEPIPEPATLSLLAIGGLLLKRRSKNI